MPFYANADQHGVISFSAMPDVTFRTLPVCVGDSEAQVRSAVEAFARHSCEGRRLLVPGVPEAESDREAFTAMFRFREQCDRRLRE
jgi:hypothetical protein